MNRVRARTSMIALRRAVAAATAAAFLLFTLPTALTQPPAPDHLWTAADLCMPGASGGAAAPDGQRPAAPKAGDGHCPLCVAKLPQPALPAASDSLTAHRTAGGQRWAYAPAAAGDGRSAFLPQIPRGPPALT
ncbi:MAG: hypothetical protein JNK11_08070 [Alphaproteobacteria bacterium]|nr:hypothetical protein [Alphaproteobacteria bacterium]